jgi:hypothetical protein
MTYPPPPGGWQDPAGGQPTYIDPVSGQPAAVSPAPTQPYPAAPYPGYPTDQSQYQQPAQPGYPTDQPQYQQPAQPGYPTDQPQYQQPGQPAYPAYPAYAGYTTPVMPMGQKTNGLAIGSLVTSIAGVVFLFCWGGGAILGLVGAILGHVSKRQIKERNEEGGGLATAGIIIGWISLALGVIVFALLLIFVVWANNQDPYS